MTDNHHSEPTSAGLPRMLLVEDDPMLADALSNALSELFDVSVAGTVATAMAALEREQFDVVFSDYELPDGNGVTILENACHTQSTSLRIIASGRPASAIVGLTSAMALYMRKPVNLALVYEQWQAHLQRKA